MEEEKNNKREAPQDDDDEQDEYDEDFIPPSKRPKVVSTIYYAVPLNTRGVREEIDFINETAECHVKISEKMPDLSSQIVEITGLPENIEKAKSMIETVVSIGNNEEQEQEPEPQKEQIVVDSIQVPLKSLGAVIGKNGEGIRRIQETSKCHIQQLFDGNLLLRKLELIGSPEGVEKAKAMVTEILERLASNGEKNVTQIMKIPIAVCGLLIGRNGENIRKMSADTKCAMMIIEIKLEGVQYKPLQITGKFEDVENAKRVVDEFLAAAPGARTQSLSDPAPKWEPPPNRAPDSSAEIMIPSQFCSLIIGKHGENIRKLREWTGCHMHIIQENNTPDQPKPLRIVGAPAGVEKATRMVNTQLEEMRSFHGMGRSPSFWPGNSAATQTVAIRIPRNTVGAIMGVGGVKIKQLSDEAGVKIQFRPDDDPMMHERTLMVSGMEHRIKIAVELIKDVVYANRVDAASTVFLLSVPASKVGLVIGKGGATIKRLNQETGARSELARESESPIIKTIVIRGSEYQVEHAKHRISQLVGDIPPNTPFHFCGSSTPPTFAPAAQAPPPRFFPAPPTYPNAPRQFAPPHYHPAHLAPAQAPPTYHSEPSYAPHSPFSPAPPPAPPTYHQDSYAPAQAPPPAEPTDYSNQWLQYYQTIGDTEGAEVVKAKIMKDLVSR